MQDLFTGGAETSSTLAEWVMSELMRHPGEMARHKQRCAKPLTI